MFKNLNPEALGLSSGDGEVIELALSYGFKGLDLDLVAFSDQVSRQGMPRARRLLDSAKLRIGSFVLPVAWQTDEPQYKQDLERLPELADLAQQLGCTRATTTIEPAGRRAYHENFEFHRRRFAEIADVLAGRQIRLGVDFLAPAHWRQEQPIPFIHSFDAVLLLVRNVGAANVGITLDLWNWHLGGGTLDELRQLAGAKIVAVYVNDAEPATTADNADESMCRLPGDTGVIEADAVLRILADVGYDGPVTPRPSPAGFKGMSREQIIRQAGAALDRVWKAADLTAAPKPAQVAANKASSNVR